MAEGVGISYQEMSYDDLFLEMLIDGYAAGILSDDSDFETIVKGGDAIENTLIIEFSIIAFRLSEVYRNLTAIHDAGDVTIATGEDLDVLALPFMERFPADYSITDLVITAETGLSENVYIPMGTKVCTDEDDSVVFLTIADATIPVGQSTVTVGIKCVEIGPVGNQGVGKINILLSTVDGVVSVTNPYASSGGRYAEDDESFRRRIFDWKDTLVKGTYGALVEAILSVSAVNSYYLDQYWNDFGTTKIIIDPPAEVTLQAVEEALLKVKAVDEDYTVVGVSSVSIDLSLVVNVSIDEAVAVSEPVRNTIKTQVINYLKVYIDGGKNADGTTHKPLGIGSDFIPFQAGKYIAEQISSIKSVDFSYPTSPIPIAPNQKAVAGNISVVVV